MPVIEVLLGISTCLGNTVIGAFLGSWLNNHFWVPLRTRSAVPPTTDGLTLKDVNQLRLKKLFLAVEQRQGEVIAIVEGSNPRIGVGGLPLRADEQNTEKDSDEPIYFKSSPNCLDTMNSMTKYIIEHSDQLWDGHVPRGQQSAHDACSNLSAYFGYLKHQRGKRPSSLAHLSGWKVDAINCDDKLNPETLREKYWPYEQSDDPAQPKTFGHCWSRVGDGRSHIVFTMCHDLVPEEDVIYRRELLAILGFMLTRMKSPYFEDHHVVPVMVISCFPDHRARILQAHLTDCDFIIRKSSPYDFSNPESREENLPLFLAYMASVPVGSTRFEEEGSSSQ
ncbi:hypothetical protein BJY00DRAFT_308923 [Aspergillus carlsbadensis]|nr:hypothetical protein BJY00DRAFT_308923 [Aspergillus carlsbadensis]